MTFLGLGGATVAWFFLGGALVLVSLYWLRQHRRRVEVTSIMFWQEFVDKRETSRLWGRLTQFLSLLLQLLILACLVLALGNPHVGETLNGRNVVLLIDTSASMNATDVRPNRMMRAKEEAKRLVREMAAADTALVIDMGAHPHALGPWETDGEKLVQQIDGVLAKQEAANLERAIGLAKAALQGRNRPTLVVFGDGDWPKDTFSRDDLRGYALHFVSVGERADNLAITAFSGRRRPSDPARFDLYLEVQNFGDTSQAVTIEIRSGAVTLDQQGMTIAAGARFRRSYSDFGRQGGRFEARIIPSGADYLERDNTASTEVPQRKQRRVLLVSEGNLFLEGALLADTTCEFDRIALPVAAETRDYDVVVWDRVVGSLATRNVPALYIAPPSSPGNFSLGKTLANPTIDQISAHPVMRNLTFGDVNIRAAKIFTPKDTDLILARSFGYPVIVAQEQPTRAIAIGFDLRKTDLPLRASFPLLLAQSLDWLVSDVTDVQAWVGALEVSESHIKPQPQSKTTPLPKRQAVLFRHDLWVYLALIALGVVFLEWFSYHRRFTV